MATNKEPIFFNSVESPAVNFIDSDGTTPETILLATGDGGGVNLMTATSTDTSPIIVEISVLISAVSFKVGEVTVPAGAGTDGTTPSKDLLDATALVGYLQNDKSIILGPTVALQVNPKATVGATFTLAIAAQGGQYATV